jgi:hypothetical protein
MADIDAIYNPPSGHGLVHDPFNSIIDPVRSAGYRLSICRGGGTSRPTAFSTPALRSPIIGFSSLRWEDTVANVRETASSQGIW